MKNKAYSQRALSLVIIAAMILAAIAVIGPGTVEVARADFGPTEDVKLTASDGGEDGLFGYSVAISGDTAIVGADGADSAYVYQRSGDTWNQQAILNASDGESGWGFGFSVAIDADSAVVGAAWAGSDDKGAAYVFERSGTSWSQQAKLTASDGAPDDWFGYSVAISGNTVVVGTDGAESAYVFNRSGSTWSQQAILASSDTSDWGFGWSVAISGDTVVVGVPWSEWGSVSSPGAACVFVRSGDTWSQQARLTAGSPSEMDQLGSLVAISGDTVVAGTGLGVYPGVYVFERSGTSWSEQAKLDCNIGSVAICGDTVVVGDPWIGYGGEGRVYVFERSGESWSQQATLTASDVEDDDVFGRSVAIDTDTIVVGSPGDDDLDEDSGAAYVYSSSSYVPDVPNAGPEADFSASPASGDEPLTVDFTDLSTSDDGIESWKWDFGDGGTSTAEDPTHEYTEYGAYTVSLTVTEADSDSDTKIKTDYIIVSKVLVQQTVTPGSSATVATAGDQIVLEFPAGSVAGDADVTIREEPKVGVPSCPTGFKMGDTYFSVDLSADLAAGITVDITVKYTDDDVAAAGGDPNLLTLSRYDEVTDQWVVLPTTVDTAAKTLTASTDKFSPWMVMAEESTADDDTSTDGGTTADGDTAGGTDAPDEAEEEGIALWTWVVFVAAGLGALFVIGSVIGALRRVMS